MAAAGSSWKDLLQNGTWKVRSFFKIKFKLGFHYASSLISFAVLLCLQATINTQIDT
jgi:hypothetical protein